MKGEVAQRKSLSWLWNGGMIAAFVAAITVFVVMLQIERNMLLQYEKGSIYVAAKEIPKGQLITENNFTEYFVERSLDKSCISETALYSPEQIQGLVAETDIEEGVLLTTGMFEAMNSIVADMREPVIAGVKAEDLYQVAGGILRAGDRIHVYSVDEEGGTRLVWENVFIQGVFDQAGRLIGNDDNEAAVWRMNVYLDKKDIVRFYEELATGSLRVVKVYE
ncbi:MAG: hypothetical protein IJF07_01865 [Lachnospiraceae bacterium]|nr:hypothetical protein [Lachnospiraceae bacterium]